MKPVRQRRLGLVAAALGIIVMVLTFIPDSSPPPSSPPPSRSFRPQSLPNSHSDWHAVASRRRRWPPSNGGDTHLREAEEDAMKASWLVRQRNTTTQETASHMYHRLIAALGNMTATQLVPNVDGAASSSMSEVSPEEDELRSSWAMCNIAAMAMPEVCGGEFWNEEVNPKGLEPFELCLGRFSPVELAKALPAKCRESQAFKALHKVTVRARFLAHLDSLRGNNSGSSSSSVSASPSPAVTVAGEQDGPGPWRRDYVIRSQVVAGDDMWKPRPYVPPADRPGFTPSMLPVKKCTRFTARPISFGMPEELIVDKPLRHAERAWDFFPFLRPFNLTHLVPILLDERDEMFIRQFYSMSHYVFTHRRGGWDCWRHLEIMAAGAVPFMPDLTQCDTLCLALYPKHLFGEALVQPEVAYLGAVNGSHEYQPGNASLALPNDEFLVVRPEIKVPTHVNTRKTPRMDRSKLDPERHYRLAERLLKHVRKYQTTKAVVSYMLRAIRFEEPKSVLFLTHARIDYLDFTIEHGLHALGINVTVTHERDQLRHMTYPPSASEMPTAAEVDWQRDKKLLLRYVHGRGIGFGMRLPHTRQVVDPFGPELMDRIEAREFDLIIISDLKHRNNNSVLYGYAASKVVGPDRVVFVNGMDNLVGVKFDHLVAQHAPHGHFFLRELEGPCLDHGPGATWEADDAGDASAGGHSGATDRPSPTSE